MTIVGSSTPAYFEEQYEALRRQALGESFRQRGHGLALFLSRGMVAWLAALSTLAARAPLSPEPEPTMFSSNPCPPLGLGAQNELTTSLASMVLACRKESHSWMS